MEFTGKEVADAIHAACGHFDVSREDLAIEVLETGSSGIFGLIRKKAKIRAELRREMPENVATLAIFPEQRAEQSTEPPPTEPRRAEASDEVVGVEALAGEGRTVSPESQTIVRNILGDMLRLMEMPSTVKVSANGLVVTCAITGPFEEELVGQDGRVIDSLQYLLRKIAARQCVEPLRIAVNVADFRQRRLEQLRAMAERLADEVRQNGKSRIIPALNPAERREIHLLLQNDPEVRSRSIGDGVFKRILIFKPGRPAGKTVARRSGRQPGAKTPTNNN